MISFHQEYEVRLDQSKQLGRRLYRSPLNNYESVLVYKLYYIPKVCYPLSITQFSQKQCNTIQSHFCWYGLPKMGINRKTPKALLTVPLSMGGFEFHDIYCDQISQHVTKLVQHMRRQDSVGRALICNINVYCVILGSATSYFKLSRARYMYAGEFSTTIYFL